MKKLGYVIAALGAMAVAVPTIASAETVVVKKHRDFGPRAEMRIHRDHGWHEGWRHHGGGKTVIIKKHRHDY